MRWVVVLCVPLLLMVSQVLWADVPETISYQGVLRESGGTLVSDGDYELTFRLYDVDVGGSSLWSETDSVTVEEGIFNVILGKKQPLDLSFDQAYWLSVEVEGGGELTPRAELASSPYAFRSAVGDSAGGVEWNNIYYIPPGFADGVDDVGAGDGHSLDASDGDPVDVVYVDDVGQVGIGTTGPSAYDPEADDLVVYDTTNCGVTIASNINSNGSIYFADGTSGADRYRGFIQYRHGTFGEKLRFGANGVEIMSLQAGKVGIGVLEPTEKLEVAGNVEVTGAGIGYIFADGTKQTTAASGGFPAPAYDSGWLDFAQNEFKYLTHGLGGDVDRYVVDLQAKYPPGIESYDINILGHGDYSYFSGGMNRYAGFDYMNLTSSTIRVYRQSSNISAPQIRVRIWVY